MAADLDAGAAEVIVLERFVTHIKKLGLSNAADIGEPVKVEDTSGITFGVIPRRGRVDVVVLDARREMHQATIRLYRPDMKDPKRDIELDLARARHAILDDIFGDFELGAENCWAEPAETTWDYGYQQVGTVHCRLLDINVSYRFDPEAVLAPVKAGLD